MQQHSACSCSGARSVVRLSCITPKTLILTQPSVGILLRPFSLNGGSARFAASKMPTAGWWALVLVAFPALAAGLPFTDRAPSRPADATIPFVKRTRLKLAKRDHEDAAIPNGAVGLGDRDDV